MVGLSSSLKLRRNFVAGIGDERGTMKIVVAQLNPTVGDIEGNYKRLADIVSEYSDKADLVVFPELYLAGYPPKDLLHRKDFISKLEAYIEKIVQLSKEHRNTGILVGTPTVSRVKGGKGLHNTALLAFCGEKKGMVHKSLLPSYDVFDEVRYFDPSPGAGVVDFKKERLGITVCEDMWNEPTLRSGRQYNVDPIRKLAEEGATIFINISASPFYAGKEEIRYRLIQSHVKKYEIPFLFVNQIGANDELIFDGRSLLVDKSGVPARVFEAFKEKVEIVDTKAEWGDRIYTPQEVTSSVFDALILGVRDYMRKSGFEKAVVGLSGGIDSAVTCAIASEAVGPGNVLGLSMSSIYSSGESAAYSKKLAENLGITYKEIPISDIYDSYLRTLGQEFAVKEDGEVGIALQNIQARIRGNVLMAFSNEFGYLLLTTGNKSEIAVGYCTLYGDMAGGLAVISDVPKIMVYKLAEYINKASEKIPREIITRIPTAELKPNQKDQDTLPPYDILDEILYYYLEEGYSESELVSKGFIPETVKWVITAINRSEYKRKQSPPGLKVTTKAFGIGRRMPIAAKTDL